MHTNFLKLLFLFSLLGFFFAASAAPKTANTDVDPPKYILYWGGMEARFQWDEAQQAYLASTSIQPAEFRSSIQREPRLWTGKTLLKELTLKIEEIDVQTDSQEKLVYGKARKSLDNLAVRADRGTTYTVAMQMPDEKPGLFKLNFFIKDVESKEKEFWQKSGLLASSIWGEKLASISNNREFLSYKDFNGVMKTWIERLITVPLTSDRSAHISIIEPGQKPYELDVPRSIADSMVQVRLMVKLTQKNVVPGTQIFLQVRPEGAWVGDFLMFHVVRDDDPLLKRGKYDRRSFGFEWGNFRFEMKGYYGASILLANGEKRPVDPEKTQKETNITTEDLKSMVAVPMRIWENGAQLHGLKYELVIDGKTFHIQTDQGIPLMAQTEIINRITAGKLLKLQKFMSDDMDLRRLEFEFTPR